MTATADFINQPDCGSLLHLNSPQTEIAEVLIDTQNMVSLPDFICAQIKRNRDSALISNTVDSSTEDIKKTKEFSHVKSFAPFPIKKWEKIAQQHLADYNKTGMLPDDMFDFD